MRSAFALCLMLAISLTSFAQTKSINKFYRQYKHQEEVTNFSLPGWLIRFGLGISGEKKNMEEVELTLVKSLKKVRLLVSEGVTPIKKEDYNTLLTGLKEESFEDFFSLRQDGADVRLYVREKKDKVKNLLLLVNEDEEFVMISLKTKLPTEVLEEHKKEFAKEILADFRNGG
jgi:hypothetical protein